MTTVLTAFIIQNVPAGQFEKNMSKAVDLVKQAAQAGASIAVFPEMNLTGYTTSEKIAAISRPVSDELISPLKHLAIKYHLCILAGLAEKGTNGAVYATQLVITPDEPIKKYRKIHTAPFEKDQFSAGNTIPVFEFQDLKFGIQLCYDAHFPELSSSMALRGIDVIFIPHASPRGTCQEKYESWLRHLTARAFDNGIYIGACNQAGDNLNGLQFPGISLLIGPDGHVVDSRTDGQEGIHLVRLDKAQIKKIRDHKMKYFLPNRRNDLFNLE